MSPGQYNELYTALSKAQGEFGEPKKTKQVGYNQTRYSYADLAEIRKAVQPALTKHGLTVIQTMDGGNLITILGHSSGQHVASSVPIDLGKNPQAVGSQITYMRRYCLSAILGVVADDDDDGQAAEVAKPKPGEKILGKTKTPEKKIKNFAEGINGDKAVVDGIIKFGKWSGRQVAHVAAAEWSDYLDTINSALEARASDPKFKNQPVDHRILEMKTLAEQQLAQKGEQHVQ